jgi:hypothetical protein
VSYSRRCRRADRRARPSAIGPGDEDPSFYWSPDGFVVLCDSDVLVGGDGFVNPVYLGQGDAEVQHSTGSSLP